MPDLIMELDSFGLLDTVSSPASAPPPCRTIPREIQRNPVLITDASPATVEDLADRAGKETRTGGIEAIAWYSPFHFYREDWGIYIREEGIILVNRVLEAVPSASDSGSAVVMPGYGVLYRHEYFHHLVEVASSVGEIHHLQQLGNSDEGTVARVGIRLHGSPYKLYSDTTSSTAEGSIEEALANAYSIQGIGGQPGEAIRAWFRTQPRGYSDFGQFDSPAAFRTGVRTLIGTMAKDICGNRAGLSAVTKRMESIVLGAQRCRVDLAEPMVRLMPPASGSILALIKSIPTGEMQATKAFTEDVARLELRDKVDRAKEKLSISFQHPSLKTEYIRASQKIFSVRLDRKYRASFKRCETGWVFLRANSHDALYRSPGDCQ